MRCIICDVRLELSRKVDICPECSDSVAKVYDEDVPSEFEDFVYINKELNKNG
jgi:uncharacterized protein with PIN domain